MFVRIDGSVNQVKLGSGASTVQRESFNASVTYILNPNMSSGIVNSAFENVNLGVDVLTLNRFTNVQRLQVAVGNSFDNKSNAPAIKDYYKHYATTALVSFTSDVAGPRLTYTFEVLVQSDTNFNKTQLQDMILSSIKTT